ncbi:hypothetical protein ACETIH_16890 [Microvirga arabica]|uniref:Glycosyl transferase n=1 Tax=Microvirga arabica TaxID=1128671 RepID=A0ABV6YAP5_9HYPH
MSSTPKFEAITAVTVVEWRLPPLELFEQLEAALCKVAADHEIVIIANAVTANVAQGLRAIIDQVANVTVHFLAQRVDRDTAVLVGIDHALGDWVVVLTPTAEEIAGLPQVLEKAGPYEIVFAGARLEIDIPTTYRRIARIYFKLYELVSGSAIDWPAPRIRVYSRAAARYLTGLLDGEFALRSLSFSGTFPGTREVITGLPESDLELPGLARALRKALRGLVHVSAAPLRITIAAALFAGFIALLSSIYAVLVYIFKENVEPGWTTLSLQISVMMFLFSVMFALLAEYVLKVYRTLVPRQRATVVRELRSPLRQKTDRLNVIDSDGSFQLGAPRQPQSVTSKMERVR